MLDSADDVFNQRVFELTQTLVRHQSRDSTVSSQHLPWAIFGYPKLDRGGDMAMNISLITKLDVWYLSVARI
jgi:hypothetical protein